MNRDASMAEKTEDAANHDEVALHEEALISTLTLPKPGAGCSDEANTLSWRVWPASFVSTNYIVAASLEFHTDGIKGTHAHVGWPARCLYLVSFYFNLHQSRHW